MTDLTVPSRLPAGVTEEGDGIMIGHGPVRVDAFIDFLCPFCRRFELSSGPTLAHLVADGQINLAYHPMNFLDQASTTNYSTRAAAASGCAADGGGFVEFAHALFVNQPPEGGPGLSDTELAGIGRTLGLADTAFTACVSDTPYLDWPPYVTARAVALGVEATPTVLVAGTAVRPEARSIAAAVAGATGGAKPRSLCVSYGWQANRQQQSEPGPRSRPPTRRAARLTRLPARLGAGAGLRRGRARRQVRRPARPGPNRAGHRRRQPVPGQRLPRRPASHHRHRRGASPGQLAVSLHRGRAQARR
jgi:protein-disulfide isomerase